MSIDIVRMIGFTPVLRVLYRSDDGQPTSGIVGTFGTLSPDPFARQYALYHLGYEWGREHGTPLALAFHAPGWMVLEPIPFLNAFFRGAHAGSRTPGRKGCE